MGHIGATDGRITADDHRHNRRLVHQLNGQMGAPSQVRNGPYTLSHGSGLNVLGPGCDVCSGPWGGSRLAAVLTARGHARHHASHQQL